MEADTRKSLSQPWTLRSTLLAVAAFSWVGSAMLYYHQGGGGRENQANRGHQSWSGDLDRSPQPFYIDERSSSSDSSSSNNNEFDFASSKKILYFTSYYDMKDFAFGFGHQPFVDHGCPVTNCFATSNRSLLPSMADYDAVMFHLLEMRKDNRFEVPNQERRKQNQRYVMFLMESPQEPAGFPYAALKGFFNWTMTYRLDSDIPRPYGWMEIKDQPLSVPPNEKTLPEWPDFDEEAFAKSMPERPEEFKKLALKPKTVAWVVSNCRTRSDRESYVRELRKHIRVDIMGSCGDTPCDKQHRSRDDNCTAAVDRDYKFYLSFENSLCEQYSTEKFWRRLGEPVVPVVMSRGHLPRTAPPHSHINVEDFASPKALAEYLLYLDQNPTAYLSYFWWKDRYRSVESARHRSLSMCELCRKLNDPQEPKRVVEDLQKWWWDGGKCLPRGRAPWSSAWGSSFLGEAFSTLGAVMGTNNKI